MANRSLYVWIAILFVTLSIGHALSIGRSVYGDGIFYYSWVRSLVIDHDLHFANEYARMQVNQPETPTGVPGNKYSVGPALLWTPAYISAHTILRGDGWSLAHQLSASMTSTLAALFGLVLIARLLGTSKAASYTVFLISTATNLLFYGAVDSANSHAASFFAACVFLSFVSAKQKNSLAIGAALGLVGLMRLQDVVYAILLLPVARQLTWRKVGLGFLLAFSPQLIAWQALYGNLSNPYLSGGETFHLARAQVFGVLFGAQNGLLLWTPIVGVGWYGLARSWRTYRYEISVILLVLLSVASWSTWWQGASYSARMMVSTLPLAAMGLMHVTSQVLRIRFVSGILPMLAVSLAAINCVLIVFFLLRT